jgi:hypothetical protein
MHTGYYTTTTRSDVIVVAMLSYMWIFERKKQLLLPGIT